jgi:formylglycine-generating enzyme required for sulfatase activity
MDLKRLLPICILAGFACVGTGEERSSIPPPGMRLIPGATFRMGTDSTELDRIVQMTGLTGDGPLRAEVPSHVVTVTDFFMDTVDVTNGDFLEFVQTNPKWSRRLADSTQHNGRYLEHWLGDGPPTQLLDHPVTFVFWEAAAAFCSARSKRLPTEVEYEWAAQDGISRSEYPWGDAPPSSDLVSWGGNGIETTVPVGSYPPNARGLYDMAGNVWRFTRDPWRGSYAEMLHGDAAGEDLVGSAERRVVRGGSWGAHTANLRIRYRDSHRTFDAREMVGFRCAQSAGPD